MKLNLYKIQGFSLVEMAVVLVIIGMMIAGLTMPITAQLDQRNYSETQKELTALTEAVMGYTLSNFSPNGKPYLPCPDVDNDGLEDREVTGLCTNAQGSIPWATLALGKQDSWGAAYIYRVTQAFADSVNGFTLLSVRDIQILDSAGGNVLASNVPAVIVSKGKAGNGAGADEIENTDGDVAFVSHSLSNVAGDEFDDLVVWVPASILFNRMVSAGRLP